MSEQGRGLRLNEHQKYWAVVDVLSGINYPVTAYEVGQRLGYRNGRPVRAVLEQLLSDGRLQAQDVRTNTGIVARYYILSKGSK